MEVFKMSSELDSDLGEREYYRRRWVKDILSTDLHGIQLAIALVTHSVLSHSELSLLQKLPISRCNDTLLHLLDEKRRTCSGLCQDIDLWHKVTECIAKLQPTMAMVPEGDYLDLLCYSMKQYHLTWLERRNIDISITRQHDLDYFVNPRIMVFCRQSFLRDVSISEILDKPKNTIEFSQLFDMGDDLLHRDRVTKVLLRGKQGYGKTAVMVYLSQKYSEGQLWPDHIVLVFFCKDLNGVNHDVSFFQLLETYHGPALGPTVWGYVAEELLHRLDRVILVLDGLGEFEGFATHDLNSRPRIVDPYAKCSMTDLLVNVINGTMLPQMKVLATSRGDCLRDIFMFHRVAELGIFKDAEKLQFAHNFANGDQDLENAVYTTLVDRQFSSVCAQPTVCRFVANYLRKVGNARGNPHMMSFTQTKIMISLIEYLIRYHHPKVKSCAPNNISDMLASVQDNIAETANLALQWLCNFPDKQYLTEEEISRHQMEMDPDVIANGFLSILTTRDFRKVVHYWFIDPLYRCFFAALGIIPNLNTQPIEDYVDKTEFRQSLLFLAGLLSTKQGLTFSKSIFPHSFNCDASERKCKLIQITEQLCSKLPRDSEDSKRYLLLLTLESQQYPDIRNIITRTITDDDNTIRMRSGQPRTIIEKTALLQMEKVLQKDKSPYKIVDMAEPHEETLPSPAPAPSPAPQKQDATEGLLPPCQLPLEAVFTSILFFMYHIAIPRETATSKEESSLTMSKTVDQSPEALNGKGKLLAEIFAKQNTEVLHHINHLHMYLIRVFNEHLEGAGPSCDCEKVAAEAKATGIILYEPVSKCLKNTPNVEWFISSVPCYTVV